jgi:hypothetical protein
MKIGAYRFKPVADTVTEATVRSVEDGASLVYVYSSVDVPDTLEVVTWTFHHRGRQSGGVVHYLFENRPHGVFLLGSRESDGSSPATEDRQVAEILQTHPNKRPRRSNVDFGLGALRTVVENLQATGRAFSTPFVHGTAPVEIPQMGKDKLTTVAECYCLWFGVHQATRLRQELEQVDWNLFTDATLKDWNTLLYVLWQQSQGVLMKRNRVE